MIITEKFATEALLLNAKIMEFICGIAPQNDCNYLIVLFLILLSSTYSL